MSMNENIYKSIATRTDGNIYLGVVGPVRTGKSTFIKRFLDLIVIPNINDKNAKNRINDQMPLVGNGKTITTTEPKFIPEDGVQIVLHNGLSLNVRLVDSVGFLIDDAYGYEENGKTRTVKTPWNEEEIPFDKAAEYGTEKVMKEHSTIGIVLLTDGSVTDIPRSSYIDAEKKTIDEMKSLNKPFIVILNSNNPKSSQVNQLANDIADAFGVTVYPCDVERMSIDDIETMFDKLLLEFPIEEINLDFPKYLEALPIDHKIKQELIEDVHSWMENIESIGDIEETLINLHKSSLIQNANIIETDMSKGVVKVGLSLNEGLYYEIMEEIMMHPIRNDKELFIILKEYADAKKSYDQFSKALESVDDRSYGIVKPAFSQMVLEPPEVFKHGNKYGVKLKAKAPCIHVIKTEITTEVSPVVGTKQQSEDLVSYLFNQFNENNNKIWETNLFGKTLEQLISEQLDAKLTSVPEALQGKIIKSLQKISDEGKDYFICIII